MLENDTQRLDRAKAALESCEYILVGGGAGLSDAAGLHYSGRRWTENFGPFIAKYGMTDMYSSSFYPFRTQEERWAYWAKHIMLNRYEVPAFPLYLDLLALVKGRNYFVVTTNVDHQFSKAGFPADQVFAVQGDYGYIQCARGCHNTLYDNQQLVREMVDQTVECKVPTALVPKCPVCGGDMDVNLRKDEYFVEDAAWHAADDRYTHFLRAARKGRTVFLELGVGFNTAGIIRFPFEQLTYANPNATLMRMNKFHPEGVEENVERTIPFAEEMHGVIKALMGRG